MTCCRKCPMLESITGAAVPSVPCEFQQLKIYYPDVEPFLFPVSFNESLFQNQTSAAPRVEVFGDGEFPFTGCCTLLMVDPDAPSPTNRSICEVILWMVSNIPWDLPIFSGTLSVFEQILSLSAVQVSGS